MIKGNEKLREASRLAAEQRQRSQRRAQEALLYIGSDINIKPSFCPPAAVYCRRAELKRSRAPDPFLLIDLARSIVTDVKLTLTGCSVLFLFCSVIVPRHTNAQALGS